MSKEKIVCSAILVSWLDSKGKRASMFLGLNYEEIRKNEFYELLYEKEVILGEKRGFITSRDVFVDPEEALEISGLGNQLRFKDRKYLLPEDLY